MKNQSLLQKITKALLVAIGVLGMYILVAYFHNPRVVVPNISSTSPAQGATKIALIVSPVIHFDRSINVNDMNVTSSPDIAWNIIQSGDTTITLKHSLDFQPQTTYKIHLMWKNNNLSEYSFTTTESQTDPQLLQEMKTELERDYPLGQSTPYETNAYRVVYNAPLTLEITPKNNVLTQEEMVNQIKEWVKSHGMDPSTHQYKVVAPTPTQSPQ